MEGVKALSWLMTVKPRAFVKHCKNCLNLGKVLHKHDSQDKDYTISCHRPLNVYVCEKGVREIHARRRKGKVYLTVGE